MFQWVTHRHVRHQCSGHSAQVFPLKRCKDARSSTTSASVAVETAVYVTCAAGSGPTRSVLLLFEATRLSDPGGPSCGAGRKMSPVSGLWSVSTVLWLLPRGVPNTILLFIIRLSLQHLLVCENASCSPWNIRSCISLCAKLTKLLMEVWKLSPKLSPIWNKFLYLESFSLSPLFFFNAVDQLRTDNSGLWLVWLKSSSWEPSTRSFSSCVVLWAQSQCYCCCTWFHKCNNIEYSAASPAGGGGFRAGKHTRAGVSKGDGRFLAPVDN